MSTENVVSSDFYGNSGETRLTSNKRIVLLVVLVIALVILAGSIFALLTVLGNKPTNPELYGSITPTIQQNDYYAVASSQEIFALVLKKKSDANFSKTVDVNCMPKDFIYSGDKIAFLCSYLDAEIWGNHIDIYNITTNKLQEFQENWNNDNTWHLIRNTEGVTGFVGTTKKPNPLNPQEVKSIMAYMKVEQPSYLASFTVGDVVKVTDGPFKDFVGTISEINDDKGQVKVLLSVFGRETPVVLDFLQVTRL